MSVLKKSYLFKLYLVALIVCIIGNQFIQTTIDNFYLSPFYIGGMVFGVLLVIAVINYFCPNCQKNQVMRSFLSYRLPQPCCFNCEYNIDENDGDRRK
jgi:hypothetical protein